MHKSIVRAFTTFSILSGRIAPSILNRNEITTHSYVNFDIDNKINDMELEREFNERKISLDKDIYKKKCFICKNNNINLKLGCNCLICFDCEKKCVKNNTVHGRKIIVWWSKENYAILRCLWKKLGGCNRRI
jgi:hypothetical protein